MSDGILSPPIGGARALSTQELLSLARTRVYQRLERSIDFPIVVLCAPSGFGKSTVLREFLGAKTRPYRSLQLTHNHADLLGFMRAFASCLGDLAPALLTSFMDVYERMHRAGEAPREIAAWAAGHLEALELRLVIDGFEHVTDERLFALLNELVDQTAHTRICWNLIAETADRFPIARWLANDRMDLPIDDIDLAITAEDLRYAFGFANAAIEPQTLYDLCRMAANHPAAIALGLSDIPTLRSTIAGEPIAPRPYAYFADRAFAAQPDREQRFLLETCLYKHFDVSLLGVAGWDGIQPMLHRLRDAGAILFADSDGSYRYHESFRAFLEERLRSSPDDLYARIGGRSAAVCCHVGRWSDALELYTGLEALGPLAELLSDHGFELIDRGEAEGVSRGLAALGESEFAAFPAALAVKASLESLYGSFDLAEAWFWHAIKNVRDSMKQAQVVFRFATDLVRRDRRDAIDLLQPVVAEEGHELGLAVSLAGLLATAYATHHENVQAALTIERALEQMAGVDDPAIRAKLYFQAGYVAFFARDAQRAKEYAQRAVATALASHLYDIAARALSILYNVAMDHEDDVDAARLYLEQLASCSIKAGSRHLRIYATLGQFEIEVICGNLRESARLDEELKSLEVDYSVFASETLLPAQALRATWSGDFHRAYRLVAPTAANQITPLRQAQRYAEIALYAAAAGLRAEAGVAVSRASDTFPLGSPLGKSAIFTKVYVALALILLGRHRRAGQVLSKLNRSIILTPRLEQLVRAVEMFKHRWVCGRYPTGLIDVLDGLNASDLGGIGRLIEALPLPESVRVEFSDLTVPERDVLVHMAAGLQSGEIATLYEQSVETIDALIGSLCRKLGCTGARHVVALTKSADTSWIAEANDG